MTRLGINIDHVATVRQARRETFPDPLELALAAIQAGADGITAHLREDRRHIQDRDLINLKKSINVPLNMEMSIAPAITSFALKLKPEWTCLVPERREELTTEGGLNVKASQKKIYATIERLHKANIKVSLFVDPDPDMMALSKKVGADAVELHTGEYAKIWANKKKLIPVLEKIKSSAEIATRLGLIVNAGHGISYENAADLVKIFPFNEFNIGFAVIARALMVGMAQAVKEMKEKMTI